MFRIFSSSVLGLLFTALASAEPAAPARASSNPDISLILNGRYAAFSQPVSGYQLPGFAISPEAGPGKEGFSLGESEILLSSIIDPDFRGVAALSLKDEDGSTKVDLEEAYFETRALPYGFTIRGGRFNSRIGYLNGFHRHADDFADRPLPYRAMLANRDGDFGVYADDGIQVRWLAPTDLYLELGAELFNGTSFPAGGAARSGKGTNTLFAHVGGDAGASHAWRAGVSRLDANAEGRQTGEPSNIDSFTGGSQVTILDFVWKWAPDRNPRQRNLKLQAEFFKREEIGTFTPGGGGATAYNGQQKGWYAQGIYQFMPRWRAGLRFDRLEAGAVNAALAGTALDAQGHRPERRSAMVDFSNSEFSRLRLQFNRDNSRPGTTDRQWFIQYITSIGAHGAHAF